MMKSQKVVLGAVLTMVLGAGIGSARAGIIDNMDTADNFICWTYPASSTPPTAVANGDGTVTLTKVETTVDSGINWHSVNPVPLTSDNNTLIVTVTGIAHTWDSFALTIVYVDAGGGYLGESPVVTDLQSSYTFDNVVTSAPAGAAGYYAKIRVTYNADSAVTLDSIQTVPEPAAFGMLALGSLALVAPRRRHEKQA